MGLFIKNIKSLVNVVDRPGRWVAGSDMQKLNTLEDAYLSIENGRIRDYGKMSDLPSGGSHEEAIDATGRMVFPSFCDSHTHLVYAGSREIEYSDKIRGLSYEEIAKRGGGILNSARLLHETPEGSLYEQSLGRVEEIMALGTGAVEIKSGYGLTVEDELKMLRVIRRLKETTPVTIRSTFLGAHSIPAEYKDDPDRYVDIVVDQMLPEVGRQKLADYVDVFCDRGFFSVEQTDRILNASVRYGMKPKIHANELDFSGGIQIGVRHQALSVDHLEYTGEEEIEALLNSETMPTLLPGAAFFLGLVDPPVRKMIEAGLPVALASDYNPGSSPSGNMKLIMSLGAIKLKMLPEEVIHAATSNGAYAMGLQDELGTITRGKKANVFITKPIPTYAFMPYAYGSYLIDRLVLNGKVQEYHI